jgi:hypothetical protein
VSVRRVVYDSQSNWALLAIALLGCALAVGSAVAWFASRQDASFWLAVATLSFATVGSIAFAGKTGDWLSPLVLGAIFYLLAYVGGAIYFWYRPDNPNGNIALAVGRPELTRAVWLALVAWVMFTVGYVARPLGWLVPLVPRLPAAARQRSPAWVVLSLLSLGWAARLHQVATGRYFHTALSVTQSTSTSWILTVASDLPLLATAFLGAWTWHSRRSGSVSPPAWMFWTLVLVETLWRAPTGGRGDLVALAIMVIVVAYYGRGVFPLRTATVATLAIVFVVFPFVEVYRGSEDGAYDAYQLAPRQHLRQAARQTLVPSSARAGVDEGVTATFSRFSDVVSLAFIVAPDAPGSGRKPGETLLWSGQAFVPRAILHHKVDPGTYGNEFGRRFGFLSANDDVISVAATEPGDLYMNFGWIGVVLLMPLVGGVFRFIGDYVSARTRDPAALAIYAVIAWPLISIHETIIAMGLVTVLKLMFVSALLLGGVMAVAPRGKRLAATQGVSRLKIDQG